jgi:hypothetical protein
MMVQKYTHTSVLLFIFSIVFNKLHEKFPYNHNIGFVLYGFGLAIG